MSTTCPVCKCNNTVEGNLLRGPAKYFAPDGLKFLTLSTMVAILDNFHACLECGHVWSHVKADELKDLINNSGKPKTKEKLDL
jgi:hypothetical protein